MNIQVLLRADVHGLIQEKIEQDTICYLCRWICRDKIHGCFIHGSFKKAHGYIVDELHCTISFVVAITLW